MRNNTNGILADTSVWIEFFKTRSTIGGIFAGLVAKNNISTCGVVLFELLQGIKSESEKFKILNILSDLPYFEMSSDLWRKAADISRSLKNMGLTLPLSDIFIASIAIEYNLSIFTLDKHFEQIPGVSLYKP